MTAPEEAAADEAEIAERTNDLVLAVALIAIGVFALIRINAAPPGMMATSGAVGYAGVPTLCSILLIGLSGLYAAGIAARLLALRAWRPGRRPSIGRWRPGTVAIRRSATLLLLVGYVLLLKAVPFFVATAAFLAIMFVLYGHRSPVHVAGVALAGSGALTLLFVYFLNLPI